MSAAFHLSGPGISCALGDKGADPLIENWDEVAVWICGTESVYLMDLASSRKEGT